MGPVMRGKGGGEGEGGDCAGDLVKRDEKRKQATVSASRSGARLKDLKNGTGSRPSRDGASQGRGCRWGRKGCRGGAKSRMRSGGVMVVLVVLISELMNCRLVH